MRGRATTGANLNSGVQGSPLCTYGPSPRPGSLLTVPPGPSLWNFTCVGAGPAVPPVFGQSCGAVLDAATTASPQPLHGPCGLHGPCRRVSLHQRKATRSAPSDLASAPSVALPPPSQGAPLSQGPPPSEGHAPWRRLSQLGTPPLPGPTLRTHRIPTIVYGTHGCWDTQAAAKHPLSCDHPASCRDLRTRILHRSMPIAAFLRRKYHEGRRDGR